VIETLRLWPLIEQRARATPAELFAIDESGSELSFAGYRDASVRCAAGLHRLGVGTDSHVSWQLPTRLESLVLVGALARLGAVQNPILPMLRAREVGFIVRQNAARFLVVPGVFRGFDHAAMAREIAADQRDLEILVADGALPEGDPDTLPTGAPEASAPPPESAPVRWIFYSSGTTAEPKGARHTDFSVGAPGRALCNVLELGPDDRNALVFPLTHVGGINWLFAGLIAGFAQIVVEAFDPARTADVLARHGVTCAGAGTVFHQAYLAEQRRRGAKPLFPRIRSFPGGGAPKPPQLHYELKAELGGTGIVSGYGLTEHPIAVMGTVQDPDDKLALTEGRATPGTELRIVSLSGAEAERGAEGEVRVRGPHLFRGYVDAALDESAFDAAGWFRTGDLGYLDADGHLAITGRLKDVIIRKGENISAKELEDHLYEHPKVRDVAVVGLPDPESGERACAVVVRADPTEPLELGELAAFLEARGLARQKIPEQLELVELLPRNASGKVLKRELQARYGSAR
jgi:acyl-CoA synthetase (AMP-forming)/AMP-acid ligase II